MRGFVRLLVGAAFAATTCTATTSSTTVPVRSPPPAAPSPSVSPSPSSPVPPAPPAFLPDPNLALPTTAAGLASALEQVSAALDASVEDWTAGGDPAAGARPAAVTLQALYQQRLYRAVAGDAKLADRVIAALPADLRGTAGDYVSAARDLSSIVRPIAAGSVPFQVGAARPAGELLAWFHEAEDRFGVRWQLLAAVMGVESRFGRVISPSSAGAQGPMQFLPSTWAAYGMGGDIHDPHDAILAAANYLHASGAPAHERQALYAYNHSWPYVDAVLGYARRMQADDRAFFSFQAWQVFVRTTAGDRRLTGPALDSP